MAWHVLKVDINFSRIYLIFRYELNRKIKWKNALLV